MRSSPFTCTCGHLPHMAAEREKRGEVSADFIASSFTLLRKAAQHPLLLLNRYDEPALLEDIARALTGLGEFGEGARYEQVLAEVRASKDLDIHRQCLECAPRAVLRDRPESISPHPPS